MTGVNGVEGVFSEGVFRKTGVFRTIDISDAQA
jgi:hypothetical protein